MMTRCAEKKKHEKISWKHLHPMKFWYRFDVCISLYFHIFMGFKSYYYKIKGITIHEPFMNHSWTSYWLSVPRVLGTAVADSTVGWLHEPWHNWWEPPSRFTRSFPSKSQSHLPSGNLTYLWNMYTFDMAFWESTCPIYLYSEESRQVMGTINSTLPIQLIQMAAPRKVSLWMFFRWTCYPLVN